jgi:hypothetical protein
VHPELAVIIRTLLEKAANSSDGAQALNFAHAAYLARQAAYFKEGAVSLPTCTDPSAPKL